MTGKQQKKAPYTNKTHKIEIYRYDKGPEGVTLRRQDRIPIQPVHYNHEGHRELCSLQVYRSQDITISIENIEDAKIIIPVK